MITLNTRFDEKDIVKELGAKWNASERCWQIPDNADWQLFAQWIPETVLKELSKTKNLTFNQIFDDISKNILFSPISYRIVADVHSVSKDRQYCYLIDDHKWYRKLRVYLGDNTQLPKKEELEDKRVEVEGILSLYNAQLQLTATRINPVGNCTRCVKIAEWEKECEDILRSVEEDEDPDEIRKRKNQRFDFSEIGLIAVKETDGYRDFMATIKTPMDRIHTEPIDTMTAENMASTIQKFIKEMNCQCICIVRGGGDLEQLLNFSDPLLLRAINESNESNIPVITGVGHKKYNLLCKRVAFYDAGTPTEAANYLNEVWKKIHYKKQVTDRDAIIAEKDEKIRELEQEIERLKKKNAGGLLSRIFNW